MARPVKALTISDEERDELDNWLRRRQMPAAEQQRARIILLSTGGLPAREIGERVGVSAETVGKWRKRFMCTSRRHRHHGSTWSSGSSR